MDEAETIQPVPGEPTRFWVPSSDPGVPHLVDMSNPLHPECSCRQWEFVCHSNWKRTQLPKGYSDKKGRTFCKHAVHVFNFLATLAN